jgi:hypothetical protein
MTPNPAIFPDFVKVPRLLSAHFFRVEFSAFKPFQKIRGIGIQFTRCAAPCDIFQRSPLVLPRWKYSIAVD